MEPSHIEESTPQQKLFVPFMAKTLQLQGNKGIYFDAACYNEKENMIIACPSDGFMQFYNATTLLPFEEIGTKQLDNMMMSMAYWSESGTYLLGCLYGRIDAYDVSTNALQKVQEHMQRHIVAITFLNSRYYAFAALHSGRLSVGNLENGDVMNFNMENNNNSCCLFSLTKGNFFISGQTNGSVQVYRTDLLPRLPLIHMIRGYDTNTYAISRKIISVIISRKEYILTVGADSTIHVWHLIKGKMRRLKVIHTKERVFSMAYLENYKMLVTTHQTQNIKFWKLLSGNLECRLDLKMAKCYGIFLIKDKNALGVSSITENKIKIVKLHP